MNSVRRCRAFKVNYTTDFGLYHKLQFIIQNNRKNEKVYLISCINGFNDAS